GPDPHPRRAVVLPPLRDRGPVAPGAPGRGPDDAPAGAVPQGHGYGDAVCQPHLLALPDRPLAAAAAAADQGEAVGGGATLPLARSHSVGEGTRAGQLLDRVPSPACGRGSG